MTFAELLRSKLDADPRSISEIARTSGVSRTQIYSYLNHGHSPTIKAMKLLSSTLGLHPAELVPPGLTPLEVRALKAAGPGGYESLRLLTELTVAVVAELGQPGKPSDTAT